MKYTKRKNRTKFAKALQSYRGFFDLSQDDLASSLEGCTSKTVSAWERGVREPDFGTLVDLAAFFQTTTDRILGRDVEESLDPSPVLEQGALIRVGRVRRFSEAQYDSYVKILEEFLETNPSKGK